MKEYFKIMKQGAIAASIAGMLGAIFALIGRSDLLHGANRFIYILGMLLVFYSLTSGINIFQRNNQEEKPKVPSSNEITNHMRARKDSLKKAPKDYLRAGTVLLIAMLLETIRFYVL